MNEALPPEATALHASPQEEIIPERDELVYNFYWPLSAVSLKDYNCSRLRCTHFCIGPVC